MKIIVQAFRTAMLPLFFVLAALPLEAAPWIETSSFFNSAGAASNYFGQSVAVDGDVAVVGQQFTGTGTTPPGSAFVFVRSGGSWTQAAILVPDLSTPNDRFGFSVAISGDTVVVGSPNRTALGVPQEGLAFVYVRPPGGWSGTLSPSAILTSRQNSGEPEVLGFSVAISGDTAAIGAIDAEGPFGIAGLVYVYDRPASGWSGTIQPSGSLLASDGVDNALLGWSVGISGDAVVGGAPGTANGKAYVWTRPAGGWSGKFDFEAAEILPSDPIAGGFFGSAASIDGTTAVVTRPGGASTDPPEEKGYVFVKPATGWAGTLNENAQLVGADVTNSFFFGQSVSISGDIAVVGAPFADTYFTSSEGAAYIFDKPAGGWTGSVPNFAKIYRGSGPTADAFGSSMAISGTTILAGAPGETIGGNPSQGAVHVFEPGLLPTVAASFTPGSVYTFQPSTFSISLTNPNTLGFLSNVGVAAANSTPSGLGIDAPYIVTNCSGTFIFGGSQFLVGMIKGELDATETCELGTPVSSGIPNTYTTSIPATSLTFMPFYCDQGCYGASSNTASLLVRLHPTQTHFLVRGPVRVAPGVPVEFPFEVSAKRSEIAPAGEVVVSDGAGQSCRAELSVPGVAGGGSCSLTFSAPGTYRVRAHYLGNLSFAGSTSPVEPVLVRGGGR